MLRLIAHDLATASGGATIIAIPALPNHVARDVVAKIADTVSREPMNVRTMTDLTQSLRRAIFDADIMRIWERRSFALDTIGDGLFLLFARDHAPLADRLAAIAGRLEAVPAHLEQAKTRAAVPQVRAWQRIELERGGGQVCNHPGLVRHS